MVRPFDVKRVDGYTALGANAGEGDVEPVVRNRLREAVEETGINPADLQPVHTFTDDHDGWSYSTVIALANEKLEGHELNDESHEVRWVKFDDVTRLPLHPSFAKTWPLVKIIIDELEAIT